eukprot:568786-Rhodomonas_salina.2
MEVWARDREQAAELEVVMKREARSPEVEASRETKLTTRLRACRERDHETPEHERRQSKRVRCRWRSTSWCAWD